MKVKPVGVKSNTYIDSSKEINDKNPKALLFNEVYPPIFEKK